MKRTFLAFLLAAGVALADNVPLGDGAFYNASGNDNVAIGKDAALGANANSTVFIGDGAGSGANGIGSSVIIGSRAAMGSAGVGGVVSIGYEEGNDFTLGDTTSLNGRQLFASKPQNVFALNPNREATMDDVPYFYQNGTNYFNEYVYCYDGGGTEGVKGSRHYYAPSNFFCAASGTLYSFINPFCPLPRSSTQANYHTYYDNASIRWYTTGSYKRTDIQKPIFFHAGYEDFVYTNELAVSDNSFCINGNHTCWNEPDLFYDGRSIVFKDHAVLKYPSSNEQVFDITPETDSLQRTINCNSKHIYYLRQKEGIGSGKYAIWTNKTLAVSYDTFQYTAFFGRGSDGKLEIVSNRIYAVKTADSYSSADTIDEYWVGGVGSSHTAPDVKIKMKFRAYAYGRSDLYSDYSATNNVTFYFSLDDDEGLRLRIEKEYAYGSYPTFIHQSTGINPHIQEASSSWQGGVNDDFYFLGYPNVRGCSDVIDRPCALPSSAGIIASKNLATNATGGATFRLDTEAMRLIVEKDGSSWYAPLVN